MIQCLISVIGSEWLNLASTIIGALLGGIISGIIAYIVAKTQINQMKSENKKADIDKFLKIFYVLSPLLDRVLALLNNHTDKIERYPLDLPKTTLINHIHGHLNGEYNYTQSKNKKDIEMAYHHLKMIIEIRDEFEDSLNTVLNLRDDYIPYEFYKTYQDIIKTFKDTLKFADKFLYHDDDVPKDGFQRMLNAFHESHSNNKTIQARLAKHEDYSQFIAGFHQYKKELDELFKVKRKELKKLEE